MKNCRSEQQVAPKMLHLKNRCNVRCNNRCNSEFSKKHCNPKVFESVLFEKLRFFKNVTPVTPNSPKFTVFCKFCILQGFL